MLSAAHADRLKSGIFGVSGVKAEKTGLGLKLLGSVRPAVVVYDFEGGVICTEKIAIVTDGVEEQLVMRDPGPLASQVAAVV